MTPRRAHQAGTRVLSSLMVVIGAVLIIQAVTGETGGGLVARLILGALFVAAGAGRLYVLARTSGRGGPGGSAPPPTAPTRGRRPR